MDALITAAKSAREKAHAPFSHFKVGAAIEDEHGHIYTGCNVENASYGLALCAERVALFAAVAQGARQIRQLAVACIGFDADAEGPAGGRMPCGACRQVMTELMPPDAMVLIDGVGAMRVMDLLPAAFRLAQTPFLDLNG